MKMATTATPAVHRRKRFPRNTWALPLGAAIDDPPAVKQRLPVDTEHHRLKKIIHAGLIKMTAEKSEEFHGLIAQDAYAKKNRLKNSACYFVT